MTNISTAISELPPEQRAIRDKCFHPTGRFVEFKREEIEQSIPDRFEQMVRLYPDRVAVKTRNHQLTYDALNKASNRVARVILSQRGEGEEPIMLLLEKDAPMIAAILGVLKAGKIYVPLDPSFPPSRITSMWEDSKPGFIVTNNKNLSLAKAVTQNKCQLINIDVGDASLSTENPGLALSPDRLAFILYTSGSTGRPMGVVQNHRNELHQCRRTTNGLHLSIEDRATLLGSMSTGQAMTDMYGALLNGGAIYPWDIKEEGLSHVATWLMEGEITIYRSTSTIFRAFIDTLTGKEKFPTIRLVRLGSEPVSKSDVEAYNQHFAPHCLFVNTLSSTEARTIRQYFVDKATLITGSLVPVGYAFEDIEILLLDENGEEVGYDRVGEIAIKSRYLTPGYWRRPDLTYTAFTSDSAERKARIYRSGDLGHMLPDGCLVHLGRKDMQVKIRGYRVELAEIEMALLEHTAVKEIAVVARENRPGDQHLVAYVVPTNRSTDTVSVLRRFLNDKLPAYMVPSVFVLLNALPRTANGKVDRLALPKSTTARPEQESPFVAPRTPAEESLAEIWTQVLGLDQVGIHDNFFDLGGHSLLATQVISRVINAFKVELPIKSLFESPTVADMTVVITENMAKKAGGEELARMLAELESISDEEARKQLADEEAKEDSEK